jgi:5'-nucleotidase
MMKILITNDDGVFAPGIVPLVEWARKLGEVTVVAPKVEQSGKSHAINFTSPIEIKRVDVFGEDVIAYSMDSTPADCVRFGIMGLGKNYDLVLSGINRGVNMGVDMIYSGTVAAIFEAAYWKHNALAISTYPDSRDEAASYLDTVWDFVTKNNLFDHGRIFNVNIPKEARGVLITRQGSPYFDDGFRHIEGDMYIQTGERIPDEHEGDLSYDTVATASGYITVTPVTLSRMDERAYNALSHLTAK